MIFKTVNSTIEKPSYTITIQNIDLAQGHWGSEKHIVQFLDEIETLYYDRENFQRNLIRHCMGILEYNIRVEEMRFYNTETGLVLVCVSDRRNFDEKVAWLDRRMEINLKRENFTFSIVEMLKKEVEGSQVPETWIENVEMNERINRLKNFV
jgi:hypothetical protein